MGSSEMTQPSRVSTQVVWLYTLPKETPALSGVVGRQLARPVADLALVLGVLVHQDHFASSSFTSLENDMSDSFSGYITVVQLDTIMTFRLHTFVQFIC